MPCRFCGTVVKQFMRMLSAAQPPTPAAIRAKPDKQGSVLQEAYACQLDSKPVAGDERRRAQEHGRVVRIARAVRKDVARARRRQRAPQHDQLARGRTHAARGRAAQAQAGCARYAREPLIRLAGLALARLTRTWAIWVGPAQPCDDVRSSTQLARPAQPGMRTCTWQVRAASHGTMVPCCPVMLCWAPRIDIYCCGRCKPTVKKMPRTAGHRARRQAGKEAVPPGGVAGLRAFMFQGGRDDRRAYHCITRPRMAC